MIRQKSFLRLIGGSLGETTFTKRDDGYRVQEKKVLPAGKFKNDPKYKWMRDNATEFTRASSGGKTMRKAFNTLVEHAKDIRAISRLQKRMREVISADTMNQKGERNLVDGNLHLLEGFQFNNDADLTTVLFEDFATTIDRVAGHLTADLPVLNPLKDIKAPRGTTHFEIVSAASEMNFESGKTVTDTKVSAMFPYDRPPTTPISNVHTLIAASTNVLVIIGGIKFYQFFNGVMNPLNGTPNALQILLVSKV